MANTEETNYTGKRIPRAVIEAMSAGDLKAVAADRQYHLPDHGGSRVTRARFIAAQNADTTLAGESEATTEEGQASQS